MLTIKKRFPYNKLYVAGSLAFIGGYGTIMLLAGYIPQRYEANNFIAQRPSVQEEAPSAINDQSEASKATNDDRSSNTQPYTTVRTSTPDPVVPDPVTPEDVPDEPVAPPVTDPIPEVPEVPDLPLPELPIDPIEVIEDIVDPITP
jgi:hypothetical protein